MPGTVGLVLLALVAFVVLTLVVAIALAFISWVLTLIFALSTLEAIVLTVVSGAGMGMAVVWILRGLLLSWATESEPFEESDDEDDAPPSRPWQETRSTSVPSGRPRRKRR
ncbi:MAG: hypothetical protein JW934_07170 [Anaerolineae bacterium]|nr:hypothetical protein [Anaerolineae bacterium]